MGNWYLTVHLSDLWRNEDLAFEEKRDRVATRIEASRWRCITGDLDLLHQLVEELRETVDLDEFDVVFSALYDLADDDRVWIETMKRG